MEPDQHGCGPKDEQFRLANRPYAVPCPLCGLVLRWLNHDRSAVVMCKLKAVGVYCSGVVLWPLTRPA